MQSPDPNLQRRQEAELRDVPLPDRLLLRLRRAALVDDEGLDATLRDVPLPSGLLAGLRKAVLVDDEMLDAAVRHVPLPAALPARLRRSVLAEDDGLDAVVRHVPALAGLPQRWQRDRGDRTRLRRLTQWATAGCLLIAIGLSYVGAMIGLLVATYPDQASRTELASRLMAGPSPRTNSPEPEVAVTIRPNEAEPNDDVGDGLLARAPKIELTRYDRPGPMGLTAVGELFDPLHDYAMLEPGSSGWGVLLSHRLFDDLPELGKVRSPIPRGVDPPLVPGFDWPFYVRHGVYPFIFPAAHPKLRGGPVPLGIDSASYELMRRHLNDDELPAAKDIRVEEFLAAVDYDFPPPTGQVLGLSTARGPSPFGDPGLLLLQVGVQGRQLDDRQHRPVHLVATVDVSASMRWGGRFEIVRRALGKLSESMGPQDRISLVSFSEEAEVVVEDVRHDEADQLRSAVKWLSLQGSTNVGAGLRQAYAVARRVAVPQGTDIHVVLLTDGLTELGRGTADLIERRLAEAAEREIRLQVIDLRPEQEPDPQLASFARVGGGSVHRAANADQVGWALQEIVTGRSQLIAEEARLTVRFNPKVVLAYRLLGHEGKSMIGLLPAQPEADFQAGQSATALYEVRLNPKGGDDVATVELTWRDAGGNSGSRQKVTERVRRGQFPSSFVKAPLSLQAAALVAETAEVLRNSPFALLRGNSRSRALARILELAARVDPRLYERPTFVEFVSLVERAMQAKAYRSGGGE